MSVELKLCWWVNNMQIRITSLDNRQVWIRILFCAQIRILFCAQIRILFCAQIQILFCAQIRILANFVLRTNPNYFLRTNQNFFLRTNQNSFLRTNQNFVLRTICLRAEPIVFYFCAQMWVSFAHESEFAHANAVL